MADKKIRILAADQDPEALAPLTRILEEEGGLVEIVTGVEDLFTTLHEETVDLVITDKNLGEKEQVDLLQELHAINPDLMIILTAAFTTVSEALDAVDQGATDCINKPFIEQEARLSLRKAMDRLELTKTNKSLQNQLHDNFGFNHFLARDPAMKEVLALAAAVADSKASILLSGESGTGKTFLARAMHENSPRRNGPFIEVNCGALPDTLLESELFGHVKGAFTGAVRDKPGKFEQAGGGTLFLDEIATATPALQVKLLRILQDHTFEKVGGEKLITADVRLILATNIDLHQAVKKGTFREDLFYRINVVNLEMPPLRKREQDILFLAFHFLFKYAEEYQRPARELSPQTASMLLNWLWPGNVRELENTMERAVVLCPGELVETEHLPLWIHEAWSEQQGDEEKLSVEIQSPQPEHVPVLPVESKQREKNVVEEKASFTESDIPPLKESLKIAEKEFILQALEACGWNRSKTARLLRIDRSTLFHKMHRHGFMPAGETGRDR